MIDNFPFCRDTGTPRAAQKVRMGIAYKKLTAAEALTAALRYLTGHENIGTVSAWCASDNIGSRKALEKAGMKIVRSDKGALEIDGRTYDKLIFEYDMR